MAVGRSLKEWKEKPAEQTVKASKRKPLSNPGTYYFRTNTAKYNRVSERLYLTGVPFRINKAGALVEYETITFFIPVTYTQDDVIAPYRELCSSLDLDSDSDISLSAFENKIVEVDIDFNDYTDEDGEITSRFFNPDHFRKYQSQ